MAEGCSAIGDKVQIRTDADADMKDFDVAIFWGFWENCQRIVEVCRRENKPWVYVDLAYWRREFGYFKVTVNDRHPEAYLMNRQAPSDRWDSLHVRIEPWKKESAATAPVLVAGMSGKAAWSWKFQAAEYERNVIARLRNITKRPIIYRPKPNWHQAAHIDGSKFDKLTPVDKALATAHCVVTHHSNVGCDAIVAGVPVFCRRGAALPMSLPDSDLTKIETLFYPEGREQWAANLAYCQWNLQEMAGGECWKYLKAHVLSDLEG
jgi:hypothetical protein